MADGKRLGLASAALAVARVLGINWCYGDKLVHERTHALYMGRICTRTSYMFALLLMNTT